MPTTPTLIVASDQRRNTGDIRSLSLRYQRGELVRVRRGIYADKAGWLAMKPWERYAATVKAVSLELSAPRLCFESAGLVWGLNLVGVPGHVHLAGASASRSGRSAPTTSAAFQAATQSTGLEKIRGYGVFRHCYDAETVVHQGFQVTPLARTVVDIIARSDFAKGVVLADHALSPERFKGQSCSQAELLREAERLASAAKRRWVASVVAFADPRSGSAGESLSRARIHALGFPPPELQASFQDDDGFVARTDFHWRKFRLIGEFDGDAKYLRDEYLDGHSSREAVLAEKKREDRLRALGFTVVRWDWATANDPERLKRKLAAAGLPAVGH
ncbi:hypothetical protein BIU82_15655 [Arthrobacter sp. SW1]|uniref:hypothetical protein n=1 Tax=Arthrobacter sp. SW1 TaxID=1920889 RepID=UPI000877E485|nr:hypothetical protein [Arthrobacter sp. SW1]OFI39079.1 hypothetical protein BIU82_15655 [Arthrobacter sp. SW1]